MHKSLKPEKNEDDNFFLPGTQIFKTISKNEIRQKLLILDEFPEMFRNITGKKLMT